MSNSRDIVVSDVVISELGAKRGFDRERNQQRAPSRERNKGR